MTAACSAERWQGADSAGREHCELVHELTWGKTMRRNRCEHGLAIQLSFQFIEAGGTIGVTGVPRLPPAICAGRA